jgi:hypothetical protein
VYFGRVLHDAAETADWAAELVAEFPECVALEVNACFGEIGLMVSFFDFFWLRVWVL